MRTPPGTTDRVTFAINKGETLDLVGESGSARSDMGHLQSISASWARFRAEANLPEQLRVHDLGHIYASHAILSGETLLTTGKLLGHASARSTERYTHLSGAALAQAAETVAQEIAKAMLGEHCV